MKKTVQPPKAHVRRRARRTPQHAANWPQLTQAYTTLSALYLTGAYLSATLDWEPLLDAIIETAVHLARADAAAVLLSDPGRDRLTLAAARGLPAKGEPNVQSEFVQDLATQVWGRGHGLILSGSSEIRRHLDFIPRDQTVTTAMCVPLIAPVPRAAIHPGVLCLLRRTPPRFNREDLKLFSAFAAQVAVAIHNARLYQDLQKQARQLTNLMDIGHDLASSLRMDAVLRLIMDRAVELLGCEAGSLLLVDPETDELIFKITLGPEKSTLLQETRLPPGVGIVGVVAREGRPLIVNDAKADPRHYARIDQTTALSTRSLLAVPLISKGRVIGVVEVLNKKDCTLFDLDDQVLLTSFGVEAAIALENARLYADLKLSFTDTVRVVTNAVEARDVYTRGHTGRVTQLAVGIASELGWSGEQLELLEIGALLHDIGKIGISDVILHKPAELTEEEYRQIKDHPVVGAKMLEGVRFLKPVIPFILYHQERYDGQGYPFGLAGADIPLGARIIAVVDAFDALTSTRPYRAATSPAVAIREIARCSGTQFDPQVVDALLRFAEKSGLASYVEM